MLPVVGRPGDSLAIAPFGGVKLEVMLPPPMAWFEWVVPPLLDNGLTVDLVL